MCWEVPVGRCVDFLSQAWPWRIFVSPVPSRNNQLVFWDIITVRNIQGDCSFSPEEGTRFKLLNNLDSTAWEINLPSPNENSSRITVYKSSSLERSQTDVGMDVAMSARVSHSQRSMWPQSFEEKLEGIDNPLYLGPVYEKAAWVHSQQRSVGKSKAARANETLRTQTRTNMLIPTTRHCRNLSWLCSGLDPPLPWLAVRDHFVWLASRLLQPGLFTGTQNDPPWWVQRGKFGVDMSDPCEILPFYPTRLPITGFWSRHTWWVVLPLLVAVTSNSGWNGHCDTDTLFAVIECRTGLIFDLRFIHNGTLWYLSRSSISFISCDNPSQYSEVVVTLIPLCTNTD